MAARCKVRQPSRSPRMALWVDPIQDLASGSMAAVGVELSTPRFRNSGTEQTDVPAMRAGRSGCVLGFDETARFERENGWRLLPPVSRISSADAWPTFPTRMDAALKARSDISNLRLRAPPDGPWCRSSGQLKKRAGRKWASSALCRPRAISSATTAPRNGDIVTPLWVMAM